jgi:hypothetical protein
MLNWDLFRINPNLARFYENLFLGAFFSVPMMKRSLGQNKFSLLLKGTQQTTGVRLLKM